MTLRILALLLSLTVFACTPKTVEEVTQTPTEEPTPVVTPQVDKALSPCDKFVDAANPNEAETKYVLYRDQLKLKEPDYQRAYELWQYVYENAPAADGQRNTVYSDGIYFQEYFMSQEQDAAKREPYIARVFEIYDEIDRCYPEGGYIEARKAFDYYYKYPEMVTDKEKYDMFKSSIAKDGMKTNDFVLNPLTDLTVRLHNAGEITDAQARETVTQINDILSKGVADCAKKNDCDRWDIIKNYAPERLEYFESIRGFYDCQYYVDKYYSEFEADPNNCDVIQTIGARLAFGDCAKTSPQYMALEEAYKRNNCGGGTTTGTGVVSQGYECLRNGDYDCAIEKFEQAMNETTDAQKKGKLALLIGKVYYAHKKNFSQGRAWAEKAADFQSGWGEPYILIGRMYASSGPLCGPGTGWDSQVVVWTAIDAWQKAKSVDPSVAGEANKWINQYSRYMPSNEDIFSRSMTKGQSYKVGCWIQRTTTVRPAS